jgi:hypothetical protein
VFHAPHSDWPPKSIACVPPRASAHLDADQTGMTLEARQGAAHRGEHRLSCPSCQVGRAMKAFPGVSSAPPRSSAER